jgi:hypothetical protein
MGQSACSAVLTCPANVVSTRFRIALDRVAQLAQLEMQLLAGNLEGDRAHRLTRRQKQKWQEQQRQQNQHLVGRSQPRQRGHAKLGGQQEQQQHHISDDDAGDDGR